MLRFIEPLEEIEEDAARATARLPNMDVEVVRHRSREGQAEEIVIKLQATPNFEAFGAYLKSANPFDVWAQAARLAWAPWVQAACHMMLPRGGAAALPGPATDDDAAGPAPTARSR